VRALVAALIGLLVPRVVFAACETREAPLVGVTLEQCVEADAEHWRVSVELSTADLGLAVSRPSERARTVERWVAETPGVRLAVQAGDFDFPSYAPEGLTVGEGEVWSDTTDDGSHALIGFDSRGVGVFVPPRQVVPAETWMDDVVSGVGVLRDGVPVECAGRGCERRSRTGLGLDATGRRLIAVVALGDRPTRLGVTDAELGALLREAGAHDGLRSGQGAWSVLWSGSALAVPSSDGESRPTAAFLGVVDRGGGAETRLRGIVGVEGMPDRVLTAARIRVESLDGRLVAEGGTLTDGAYWEYTLPVREYVVRASLAGYRTGCKLCVGVPSSDVWCSVFLTPGEGSQVCAPPPRTLEVGPWPEAMDAGVSDDAGIDAGPRTGSVSGCAVGAEGRGWIVAVIGIGAGVVRRRRR
jgi:MYXO-CTERM domain-containing protein